MSDGAFCSACGKYVTVNNDGALRAHGPRNNRCDGVAAAVESDRNPQ